MKQKKNPRDKSQKPRRGTYDLFEGRKEELRLESLVSAYHAKS